tara:strand:+ start:684 stop:1469 length:786 start_codon:yes stop_codon:yes gene_type:complete
MPGYKKPKMGHKKPKMAHGKKPKMGHKPKMAHGNKPQFNAKLKKAAAEGKLDNNPNFKSAVENAKPKMGHKKPKMAHGDKPKMSRRRKAIVKRSGVENFKPDVNENISDFERLKRGKASDINFLNKKYPTEKSFQKMVSKKSGKPNMYGKPKMYNKKPFMMNPGSKEIDSPSIFKANEPAMMFKNNMPKQTKFRDGGGKRSGETLAEYRNRLSGTPDPNFIGRIEANKKMEAAKKEKARIAEITKKRLAKRSGKPNMYGKK